MISRSIRLALCIATLLLPALASAQSIHKYFGYFGADQPQPVTALPEFKDHINLYFIGNWEGHTTDAARSITTEYMLQQLAQAKAAHVQAMIPAFPYVFQRQDGSSCWLNEPNASANWDSLVQTLIDNGYLTPGQPDRSTVAAIYLVDEPNLGPVANVAPQGNCLADVNGAAHPALQNAVAAIKSNPATTNVPIASVLSVSFNNITQGMKLFDWVGFDDYYDSQATWNNYLQQLKSYVPNKKIILVPGGQSGTNCVPENDPTPYISEMNSDPNAVWLAPFTWVPEGGCEGVGIRDIPNLRTAYTNFGQGVKAQGCTASPDAAVLCRGVNIAPIINMLLNDAP
jgi:hypothetical protein